MTLCLALLLLAAPTRANDEDPRLVAAFFAVRDAGGERGEKEFRERLARARESARFLGGCVVVGRIALKGPGDPAAVSAQMMIFAGGYFADGYDPKGNPIGFRAPGYEELAIKPACPADGGVVWQELTLVPAAPARQGTVVVRLPKGARAFVYPSQPETNDPHSGVDARHACMKGKCPTIPFAPPEIDANGDLKATGLAPMEHYLRATSDGFISVLSTFTIRPGETTDLGVIALEKAKRLTVRYLVSDTPRFEGHPMESEVVAGQVWRAKTSGVQSYGDVVFDQEDGRILMTPAVGPALLADLGAGSLDDFASKVEPTALDGLRPYRVPLVAGHVYALRQTYLKRWILLSADER